MGVLSGLQRSLCALPCSEHVHRLTELMPTREATTATRDLSGLYERPLTDRSSVRPCATVSFPSFALSVSLNCAVEKASRCWCLAACPFSTCTPQRSCRLATPPTSSWSTAQQAMQTIPGRWVWTTPQQMSVSTAPPVRSASPPGSRLFSQPAWFSHAPTRCLIRRSSGLRTHSSSWGAKEWLGELGPRLHSPTRTERESSS